MITKPISYEIKVNPSVSNYDSNELKAYTNIARQIGFLPTEVLRILLLTFFRERGVKVFDYRDVYVYLVKQGMMPPHINNGKQWVWRPLRDGDGGYSWGTEISEDDEEWRDKIRPLIVYLYGGRLKESDDEYKHPVRHLGSRIYGRGYYRPDDHQCRPYDKVIPMRILDRVREIEEYIPGRIRFFVSDYVDPRLRDPFIAAKIGWGRLFDDLIVFDCWDEPGFTG